MKWEKKRRREGEKKLYFSTTTTGLGGREGSRMEHEGAGTVFVRVGIKDRASRGKYAGHRDARVFDPCSVYTCCRRIALNGSSFLSNNYASPIYRVGENIFCFLFFSVAIFGPLILKKY